MTREVPLTRGYVALVDDEDYEDVISTKWHVHHGGTKTYAKGWRNGKDILLHRYLLGDPPGVQVDHVDGDGLNCQRSNLRRAVERQNSANRKRMSRMYPYKGVNYHGRDGLFCAQIKVGGVPIRSRWFKSIEDAAHAYDELAREHFGEFARLNFPRDGERAA